MGSDWCYKHHPISNGSALIADRPAGRFAGERNTLDKCLPSWRSESDDFQMEAKWRTNTVAIEQLSPSDRSILSPDTITRSTVVDKVKVQKYIQTQVWRLHYKPFKEISSVVLAIGLTIAFWRTRVSEILESTRCCVDFITKIVKSIWLQTFSYITFGKKCNQYWYARFKYRKRETIINLLLVNGKLNWLSWLCAI